MPRPQVGSGGGEALGLPALVPWRRETLPPRCRRGPLVAACPARPEPQHTGPGGAAGEPHPWARLLGPSLRGRGAEAPLTHHEEESGRGRRPPRPLWPLASGLGGAPEGGAPRGGQAWGSLTQGLPACCPAGRCAVPFSSPRSGLCIAVKLRCWGWWALAPSL